MAPFEKGISCVINVAEALPWMTNEPEALTAKENGSPPEDVKEAEPVNWSENTADPLMIWLERRVWSDVVAVAVISLAIALKAVSRGTNTVRPGAENVVLRSRPIVAMNWTMAVRLNCEQIPLKFGGISRTESMMWITKFS